MTRAELERKAVAEHRCRYCGASPGKRCRRWTKSWALVELLHPHQTRIRQVTDQ